MNVLDFTYSKPVQNLACDEALLDAAEATGGPDVLRFWEPRTHFVVLGYGDRAEKEVNAAACRRDGIPILRRSSGGGTVLQGPGCLNYSLILKIDTLGPLRSIVSANRFIMERNRAALESAVSAASSASKVDAPVTRGSDLTPSLSPSAEGRVPEAADCPPPFPLPIGWGEGGRRPGEEIQGSETISEKLLRKVSIRGHTDLAMGELKFSGNAQRRKKHFLLFHGTFLLGMKLDLLEKYLPMPSRQPTYRQARGHSAFVMNLNIPAEPIKHALQAAWKAAEPLLTPPQDDSMSLICDKYETNEWIFRI